MAEMVCRSVQLCFPSTAISGGQSAGAVEGLETTAGRVEDDDVAVDDGVAGVWDLVMALVMAAQSANGVQVRHLWSTCENRGFGLERIRTSSSDVTYGFPSFPRTTPLGNALRGGGGSPSPRSVDELLGGDDGGCDRLTCSVKNFSIPFGVAQRKLHGDYGYKETIFSDEFSFTSSDGSDGYFSRGDSLAGGPHRTIKNWRQNCLLFTLQSNVLQQHFISSPDYVPTQKLISMNLGRIL